MNKMVINHLEKLFVTSDASTIISELEVNHPAAKLVAMAAKAQEAEIGDGTNLVGDVCRCNGILAQRARPAIGC
jgi:T-complex protein 1 subunit theta